MEGVFFISFYETMLLQQKQLQQKLTDIQKQLQQLPEGKLICTRCGNRTKWYRSDGHTKTYIPKDQKPHASQLAIRRYLLEKQKEYQKNLDALAYYFRHSYNSGKAEQLLTTIVLIIHCWQNIFSQYPRNFKPGNHLHITKTKIIRNN